MKTQAQNHEHKLKTIEDIERHIFGGNSTFTVVSVHRKNDTKRNNYTFKANRNKYNPNLYSIKMLNGPDNINNYKEIGYIRIEGDNLYTWESKYNFLSGRTKDYIVAMKWIVEVLLTTRQIPQWDDGEDKIHIYHTNRCCRCNKELTVESSILNGVGPECIKYFMIEQINGTKMTTAQLKVEKEKM